MGSVRLSLEYGVSTWATAAKTHTYELDNIKKLCFEDSLCATKTIPIAEMEKTVKVEPPESRRQAKLLIHAEKMKRMPDHPPPQKLKDPPSKKELKKQTNKKTD